MISPLVFFISEVKQLRLKPGAWGLSLQSSCFWCQEASYDLSWAPAPILWNIWLPIFKSPSHLLLHFSLLTHPPPFFLFSLAFLSLVSSHTKPHKFIFTLNQCVWRQRTSGLSPAVLIQGELPQGISPAQGLERSAPATQSYTHTPPQWEQGSVEGRHTSSLHLSWDWHSSLSLRLSVCLFCLCLSGSLRFHALCCSDFGHQLPLDTNLCNS